MNEWRNRNPPLKTHSGARKVVRSIAFYRFQLNCHGMDSEENTDAHNNSAHRELGKRKLIDGLVILLLIIVVVVVISSCLKFV
ncbi:MAG: hypothetical protein ACXV2E_05220 [Halobacteriota archaeon]